MPKRTQSTIAEPEAKHLRSARAAPIAAVFSTPELVTRILKFTRTARDFRAFALSFSLAGHVSHDVQDKAKDKFATRIRKEEFAGDITIIGSCLPNQTRHGEQRVYHSGMLRSCGVIKNNVREGVWRVFYSSGILFQEATYVASKLHGLLRDYTETGMLWLTANYVAGKKHGVSEQYWSDGSLRIRCTFEDDMNHGPYKEYHSNGRLAQEVTFFRGNPVGVGRVWAADGTLEGETVAGIDGFSEQQIRVGNILEIVKRKNGQLHGRCEERDSATNRLLRVLHYEYGELHGPLYKFKDGRLKKAEHYRCGKKHGVQKKWINGKPFSVETYRKGKQHGPQRYFWPNGRLRNSFCMFNGHANGIDRYYTPSGRKCAQLKWSIGEIVSKG